MFARTLGSTLGWFDCGVCCGVVCWYVAVGDVAGK